MNCISQQFFNKGLEMNAIKAIVLSGFSLAIISLSVPLYADDIAGRPGTQLMSICNDKIEAANGDAWVMCELYVNGIVEGLQVGIQLEIVHNNPNITSQEMHDKFRSVWPYCQPNNVTGDNAARVVTNFITEHPNDLNNSASALIMGAFINAWPCTNK